MGLHGGYGAGWSFKGIQQVSASHKGEKKLNCLECGAKFFLDSRMGRLHRVDNDKVICKRDSLHPSICKINKCGGLILPSKIISDSFVCNRCSLTYTQLDGVFIR